MKQNFLDDIRLGLGQKKLLGLVWVLVPGSELKGRILNLAIPRYCSLHLST